MNDDQLLESEIRKLRPAPLPADLRDRMAGEPSLPKLSPLRRVAPWAAAAGLAAAACIAIVAIVASLPAPPEPITATKPEAPVHLSIIEQESTLLDTRSVAIREHNGRTWELLEQEWRDETVAICSATPVRVRSTVIRPEAVWVPVKFQ